MVYSGVLFIETENPYGRETKKDGGLFGTLKNNAGEHGYGLKSVKRTIGAYRGSMEVSSDSGIFKVQITIPDKS